MVVVLVRHVQEVGPGDGHRVDPLVAGEGEPGREVGRAEPGIAQDAALAGLDEHPGMAEEGDPHDRGSLRGGSLPPGDRRKAVPSRSPYRPGTRQPTAARGSTPRAASRAAAALITTASPCWGPTSWMPTGSPAEVSPAQTVAAGDRVRLKG